MLMHGGIAYSVRIDASAEHPLQVWRGQKLIADSLRMAYHPWSLQVADVDGDDIDEIAVGLTKPTQNLPFPHTTLFVMRFDGHQITRKWAASTLGRPLVEFCFSPKEKGKPQTLFTLEKTLDGKIALSAKRWTGFGFQNAGKPKSWRIAARLRCSGDRLLLSADNHQISLPWRELL